MNLQSPPEIADGGYWYVVETATDDQGSISPNAPTGPGRCCWYAGAVAAVRYPEPAAGIVTLDAPLDQVLTAGKPRGRVGGN